MEAVLTAAEQRLEAVWPNGRAYLFGDVPANAQTPYVSLSVTSPAPVHVVGDGAAQTRMVRLVAQCFGSTMNEALRATEAVDRAYISHRLDVPGWRVSPPDPRDVVTSGSPRRDPDAEDGGLIGATVVIPLYLYPQES